MGRLRHTRISTPRRSPQNLTPTKASAGPFFLSDEDCEVSYKDKKGKYQAQSGIVSRAFNQTGESVHLRFFA